MALFKIHSLKVSNFRNIKSEIVNFTDGINCIIGENGNGKTNLLEAVYYLTHRKSFRKNTSFAQFLNADGDKPEIIFESAFSDGEKSISYNAKIHPEGQTWSLDGKITRSKINAQTVLINPFDSFQFHNIPAFRRQLIDNLISIIDANYNKALREYEKVLRFRNKLIQSSSFNIKGQLIAIDEKFANLNQLITAKRSQFLKEIKQLCKETFNLIFSEKHEIELALKSKFLYSSASKIKDFYYENMDKDLCNARTSYGAHKDDYLFYFDGINSYEYCSLGQQKMSFLSLLFAYIELFRYKFNSYPIVLIDDVSGELDSRRWKLLINYLEKRNFQVLITTANENFKRELDNIDRANKLYVSQGSIHNGFHL